MLARHSWSGPLRQLHQAFELEPATTSDGVSEPFLIGCYINASLGSWAEGELIYANFRQ